MTEFTSEELGEEAPKKRGRPPKVEKEPVFILRGYFPKKKECEYLSETRIRDQDLRKEGAVPEGTKCLVGHTYLMDTEVARGLANERIVAFGEEPPSWWVEEQRVQQKKNEALLNGD